jgi:DNA mismatch endonuclease (patch repair protein)
MADVFSKAKRSRVMSRIRSRGNKDTELRLIAILRRYRVVGWRRGQKLIGNPDFVFRNEKVAVFVDGCFWHGCPRCYRAPTSNEGYWTTKHARNRLRDKKVSRGLRRLGWRVVRIWEHQLRKPESALKRILRARSVETELP